MVIVNYLQMGHTSLNKQTPQQLPTRTQNREPLSSFPSSSQALGSLVVLSKVEGERLYPKNGLSLDVLLARRA